MYMGFRTQKGDVLYGKTKEKMVRHIGDSMSSYAANSSSLCGGTSKDNDKECDYSWRHRGSAS